MNKLSIKELYMLQNAMRTHYIAQHSIMTEQEMLDHQSLADKLKDMEVNIKPPLENTTLNGGAIEIDKYELLGLPQKKGFDTPPGGWKAHTYYLVKVAFSRYNPIHYSILGVEFLYHNYPSSTSYIFNNSYEDGVSTFSKVYYMAVIKELFTIKR